MSKGTAEMYYDMPNMYDDSPGMYDNTPEKYDDKPPLVCLKQCYNKEDSHHRHDESQICMMILRICMMI